MNFEKRRHKLISRMKEHDISLSIITDLDHIYYLTGYHHALGAEWGRPQIFIISENEGPVLIVPSLEAEMAERQTHLDNIITWDDGEDNEWRKPLNMALDNYNDDRIAVDYFTMPHIVWNEVVDQSGAQNVDKIDDIGYIIDEMRMVKDEDEIQIARHAGQVGIAMLEGAMEVAGPGVPEYRVSLGAKRKGAEKSAELMRKYYSENEPFNFPAFSNQQVMTSGHDTTMTHSRSGLTELEHGEPLFICHCGTLSFQGFNLGFDRTLFVGEVNAEVADLLDVAEEAQAASLAQVKPGVRAEAVFEAYADVIQEAGFEVPFRAGRSVGFSVQEDPQLEQGSQTKLQEGMIFAMDGGAANENYRTQVGDSILVTEDGYELLTPFTKDHKELVVNN